ncbi:L-fucose isomerase [Limihaloglobus sulfuriphilus]|uniref:L-fucose isomerase n=1 Tax=Limihaloglobus sulfuriphilus TaxID=1851148 RepID=A0A1Q2MCH1_9BACT|nr:L-fucose/L-arabinose isomerase family protein [Limihaloglobus sulfuriphilus]AQQ70349.1 L-fucose isomerase [Limihaloglobus sulfuriphilus]
MSDMTFGVIVSNRGFFPDKLAQNGRQAMLSVLKKAGYNTVSLDGRQTKYGTVETLDDAKKCADLFKANAEKIDGIIITLPNFGDERGATEAIRRSGLDVPVLIHAEADQASKMTIANRRDSFCGKISVCNNLYQAGIPYTLTSSHTMPAKGEDFAIDLDNFAAVCRIIKGLKNVRFGAIGARPAAFNTVRYSEKILERYGISVEPVDLSEILARAEKLKATDKTLKAKLAAIKKYVPTKGIAAKNLMKMARLGTAIDQWAVEADVSATTIQCWTSLEENYGIVPCALMSMMSENLMPSACEVDVTGLLGMYILQLASGKPSAILDWNNNYGDDPDKCVLFHCSNLPKSFFESAAMEYQAIIAGSVGKQNTEGTICGRIAPNPVTFCRTSTDDSEGLITCYVGEGEFTDDQLETFGGYGVMYIPALQELMEYICKMGFEHHVAVNICQRADAITEALENYMGWEVYHHS